MTQTARIPLRPDYSAATRPGSYLFKAASIALRAAASGSYEDDPSDRVTPVLFKAATTPTALADSPLASIAVADAIVGLAGQSAMARLIARSMRLNLIGHEGITIPLRIVAAADAGAWIAEGAPIPAARLDLSAGPTVVPYKVAVLVTYSNELARASSAATILPQLVSDATALTLDLKGLSADALVEGISPPGLLAGVVPLTGTTGGGVTALLGDLKKALAAMVTAGAGVAPVLIVNPVLAASLKCLAGPKFDYPILVSNAVAATSMIVIEPSSLVTCIDPTPEFRTSSETVIHESTVPLAVSAEGTPSTVAAPLRSLWQTDCTSLRMILRASWAMRAVGHVQIVNTISW